jgi:hypothetical protein
MRIEAGWLPLTWFGESLARPRAVALTDRALLLFDVGLFDNDGGLLERVPLDEVNGRLKRRRFRHWTPIQGSRPRLDLALPDRKIRLYLEGDSALEALALALRRNRSGRRLRPG